MTSAAGGTPLANYATPAYLRQLATFCDKPSRDALLRAADRIAELELASRQPVSQGDGCICKGNWRLIVAESEPDIGKIFVDQNDGRKWRLYGIVHGGDDYYYGVADMDTDKTRLLSCVGSLEGHGLLPSPPEGQGS